MKIYRDSDSLNRKRNEVIDLGFDAKDNVALANERNLNPPIQIFTRRKFGYLNKLDDQFCSSCNTKLVLLERTQKLLCFACGSTISVMANTPLLETNQELRPYATQFDDPNNEDRPWFIGFVNDDDEENEPAWEVTGSSNDGRVQSIRLKRGASPSSYRIKP